MLEFYETVLLVISYERVYLHLLYHVKFKLITTLTDYINNNLHLFCLKLVIKFFFLIMYFFLQQLLMPFVGRHTILVFFVTIHILISMLY